ncbi:MAG: HisA/HisF-related TIM barrel protein [Methanothrix sp.]|nr:HisA/HisF-related TIM barrel protein [Methanothrix sp.]
MRCIFVLDIFNGAVVHAVRGERGLYEPIERHSRIVSTSDPLGVLGAVRPREVYVADLNRLMGLGDGLDAVRAISGMVMTMADIGISLPWELELLPEGAVPVLGTETASLELMKEAALRRRIVVSMDLRGRRLVSRDPELAGRGPIWLLRRLNSLPLESVVLLDLERVGTASGLDLELLRKASSISEHPLILGGGVRGTEDIELLHDAGFSGALVATAVHSGRIPLEMIR